MSPTHDLNVIVTNMDPKEIKGRLRNLKIPFSILSMTEEMVSKNLSEKSNFKYLLLFSRIKRLPPSWQKTRNQISVRFPLYLYSRRRKYYLSHPFEKENSVLPRLMGSPDHFTTLTLSRYSKVRRSNSQRVNVISRNGKHVKLQHRI